MAAPLGPVPDRPLDGGGAACRRGGRSPPRGPRSGNRDGQGERRPRPHGPARRRVPGGTRRPLVRRGVLVPSGTSRTQLPELRQRLLPQPDGGSRSCAPLCGTAAGELCLWPPRGGHPAFPDPDIDRDQRGRVAPLLLAPGKRRPALQVGAAQGPGRGGVSGRQIPSQASLVTDEQISFVAGVIDDSGVATRLEGLITCPTGRKRTIPLRSLLVALLLLASLDRPLHLKAATRLLFCDLPSSWRQRLGTGAPADTRKCFLARYRCVRYLFHRMLAVIDPSLEQKNAIVSDEVAERSRRSLTPAEIAEREERLAEVLASLLDSSVAICSAEELDR